MSASTTTKAAAAWWRLPLGVLLGLLASATVAALVSPRPPAPAGPPARLLSDCDGAIRELVIHYVAEAGDVVGGVYGDFLRQLSSDVVVQVVCPDMAAFDDLIARVGSTDCRLEAVVVGHPITTWSRDRWLALAGEREQLTTLLGPRREKSEEIWPERAGDARVGDDLAGALGRRVAFRRSSLLFDGGDFVADGERVFVTPDVLLRNLQQTVYTRDGLQARLERALNRPDRPVRRGGRSMSPGGLPRRAHPRRAGP